MDPRYQPEVLTVFRGLGRKTSDPDVNVKNGRLPRFLSVGRVEGSGA